MHGIDLIFKKLLNEYKRTPFIIKLLTMQSIILLLILLGLGIKGYVYILVVIDILGIIVIAIGGILLLAKGIKFLFFPKKINIEGNILEVKEEMVPLMIPMQSQIGDLTAFPAFSSLIQVPHCTLRLKSLKGVINIELSKEHFIRIRDEFKNAHSYIKLKCSKIFAINEITADEIISQS